MQSLVDYDGIMATLNYASQNQSFQVRQDALMMAIDAMEQLKKERDACAQVMDSEHRRCLVVEKSLEQAQDSVRELRKYNAELARDNEYRGDVIRSIRRAVDRFPATGDPPKERP